MLPSNVKFLSTPRYLHGGVSTGNYGNFNLATHTGDDLALVEQNRDLLIKQYDLPSAPKWLNQTHSDRCADARSNDCDADAAITNQKGVVCAILTADCLPIFASNTAGTQVGVAHAGWQGIVGGVIESFISEFNAPDVQVHFGPAISQKSFEVGEDVHQQFMQKDSNFACAFAPAFEPKAHKYQLDIYQAASIVLNTLGIKSISGGDKCTCAQKDKYFSYRRDGAQSGRMAHLIWAT